MMDSMKGLIVDKLSTKTFAFAVLQIQQIQAYDMLLTLLESEQYCSAHIDMSHIHQI